MQTNQLENTLKDLLLRIQSDSMMDDEDKANLISLINEVVADPTPENLEALALVLDELGNSQEYMVAREMIANYDADSAKVEDVE